MRRIAIGEEQEYVRRLSDYLIRHLPADVRVYTFTTPELMLAQEECPDIYLIGETFYERLLGLDPAFSNRNILMITTKLDDEGYYRWDSPAKLVRMLEDRLSVRHKEIITDLYHHGLTALYAPFSGIRLRGCIWDEMRPGDLYVGLEDMGSDNSSMAELCYFIHLHDENILDEMRRLLSQENGIFYLDSPRWYFDYLGLKEEDYTWFYDFLKDNDEYADIYVGLGNAAVTSMEYFRLFDRLILIDVPGIPLIHNFCDRFVHTIVEEGYLPSSAIELREYDDSVHRKE